MLNSKSDQCSSIMSIFLTAVLYAISCHITQSYNWAWLCCELIIKHIFEMKVSLSYNNRSPLTWGNTDFILGHTLIIVSSINQLAPKRSDCNIKFAIFKLRTKKDISSNSSKMNATRPHWWSVNLGSGNGLVPSGNKPLPEPMLTKFYDIIWHHNGLKPPMYGIKASPLRATLMWQIPSFENLIMAKASSRAGLILGLRPANERHRYKVTQSLIGWAKA